jgi:hypothetical protein
MRQGRALIRAKEEANLGDLAQEGHWLILQPLL